MADYVDEILNRVSGRGRGRSGLREVVGRLVEVGEMDPAVAEEVMRSEGGGPGFDQARSGLPSPAFERSTRNTARRSPLGFVSDQSPFGNDFSVGPGASVTMRAKVSRTAHVDRLLIMSAPVTGLIVTSIKVGDVEQMLAPGVPAELYGPQALTDSLADNFEPLGPGLDFIVTLFNTTAATTITGTIGTKALVRR